MSELDHAPRKARQGSAKDAPETRPQDGPGTVLIPAGLSLQDAAGCLTDMRKAFEAAPHIELELTAEGTPGLPGTVALQLLLSGLKSGRAQGVPVTVGPTARAALERHGVAGA